VHPSPSRASHILTGGLDKVALLYDASGSGRVLARLAGHTKRISGVALHPARDVCLTSSHDSTVRVWAPSAVGEYGAAITVKPHAREAVGVSLHPTGDYAVSAGREGTWALTDINAGKVMTVVGGGGSASTCSYECVRVHVDGMLVAVGTDGAGARGAGAAGGSMRIFDLRNLECVATLGGAGGISALSFSENGFHLASGGLRDGVVSVWDLRKLAAVCSLPASGGGGSGSGGSGGVTALAYDPTGLYLAAGTADGVVSVWESKAAAGGSSGGEAGGAPGEGLLTLLKGQAAGSAVGGLAWSAAGRTLVSGGFDKSLTVYGGV
jgi:pre-mRNA-processing factor 19